MIMGYNRKMRLAALVTVFMVFWTFVCGMTAFGAQSESGSAAEQRVFDMAGLLSDEEKDKVEESIASSRKKTGMDVVAVTAFHDGKRSAMEYADDFYDQNGYGTGSKKSGVLVLLYMDAPGQRGGESWISTSGNMIRILTDSRIEAIQDDMAEYLRYMDYSGAFMRFAEDIEYYVDQGIQRGQYNYDTETGEISVYKSIRWYEAAFALIVPAMIAGSVCLGVKGRYSMKQSQRDRSNALMAYRADTRFMFSNCNDLLLNKFVTSVPIPRNTGGSGGSGGGHSSSGRSSTHTSSGGHSHGGGGRRF